MPIEFGAAAYRFGHSMVRPSYRANFTSGTGDSSDPTANPFFALGVRPERAELLGPVTTTATTCSAATPPRDGTSAGRPSSTSATGRSRTTRRSTPRSPASCSPCRCPRSRRTPRPRPPCCRSATCCASSPGACPPGRRSRGDARRRRSCPASYRTSRGVRPVRTSTPLWYYILAEAKALAGGLTPRAGRRPDRRRDADRPPARRPHQLPQRLPALPAVPRRRPPARPNPQPEHHRQPHLHPRALPPLRRRGHPRQVPMTTQLLTPTLSLPALTRRQTWPESR